MPKIVFIFVLTVMQPNGGGPVTTRTQFPTVEACHAALAAAKPPAGGFLRSAHCEGLAVE